MFLNNKKVLFITASLLLLAGVFFAHPASSVSIPEKVLKFITITTPADKLSYYVGESFDVTGLSLTGTYVIPDPDDGDIPAGESIIPITPDNITGFNSEAPAVGQVLTITVDGITTTYAVDIVVKPVLKILTITDPAAKLTYYLGESLDITGLSLTGTYVIPCDDGEMPAGEKSVLITVDNVTGFNSEAPAVGQVLTITVDGITTTYAVDVKERESTLKILTITTPATKLTYYVGETLDITGLALNGTYVYKTDDGEMPAGEKSVLITADNITGFNSGAPAVGQVLTITVDGIITTYTVDIVAKTEPQPSSSSSGGSGPGMSGGLVRSVISVAPAIIPAVAGEQTVREETPAPVETIIQPAPETESESESEEPQEEKIEEPKNEIVQNQTNNNLSRFGLASLLETFKNFVSNWVFWVIALIAAVILGGLWFTDRFPFKKKQK